MLAEGGGLVKSACEVIPAMAAHRDTNRGLARPSVDAGIAALQIEPEKERREPQSKERKRGIAP